MPRPMPSNGTGVPDRGACDTRGIAAAAGSICSTVRREREVDGIDQSANLRIYEWNWRIRQFVNRITYAAPASAVALSFWLPLTVRAALSSPQAEATSSVPVRSSATELPN